MVRLLHLSTPECEVISAREFFFKDYSFEENTEKRIYRFLADESIWKMRDQDGIVLGHMIVGEQSLAYWIAAVGVYI